MVNNPQLSSLIAHFGQAWVNAVGIPQRKAVLDGALVWTIAKYGSQNPWAHLEEDLPEPADLGIDADGPWTGDNEAWLARLKAIRQVSTANQIMHGYR